MRRAILFLFVALVVCVSRAEAFTALRGTPCNASATATSVGCTVLNANIDVGDLCVAAINVRTSSTETVSSVTDDRSNTWTQRIRHTGNATYGDQFTELWTMIAGNGADTALTINFSGSVSSDIGFGCFSGSPAAITITDSKTGETDNNTSHGTAAVSCGTSGLYITTTSVDSAFTHSSNDTGYTTFRTGSRMHTQYRIPTGSESDDGAWVSTTGVDTISAQICITDSAAVATSRAGTFLLGGMGR